MRYFTARMAQDGNAVSDAIAAAKANANANLHT